MMKRIALIFTVLFLLAIQASALAEVSVFFNKEPPADWQDRDLMRLIVFNSTTNDAMLLECGGGKHDHRRGLAEIRRPAVPRL